MATDDRPSKRKGLSRKEFLARGAAAGAGAAALGGAGVASASPRMPAAHTVVLPPALPDDLMLVNGQIHTMDPSNRVVSSVLIRDGRFAVVGNVPFQYDNVPLIDLGGR